MMEHLNFRPLDAPDARAILAWRYEGPYAVYNPQPPDPDVAVAILTDPANAYFAARDETGALIGFCCFGADAQVPGGNYNDPDPLDIGLGLRPDLTGGGRGLSFLLAVLALGREHFAPTRFRLTVAAFNERAQKVYARAGFRPLGRFRRGEGVDTSEFLIMIEGAPPH
jgi:ribosomal-protein-alanine N-acetyltransferase